MTTKQKLLTGVVLIFFFLFNVQAYAQKGKLFIIGGGKRPASLIARLIDEAGLKQGGYGIILPMASSEPDSATYYALKQFSSAGLRNVVGFNFKANQAPRPSQLDSLRNANMIYISGGDQNKFMAIARKWELSKIIKNCYYKQGGTIAGTSAGAAVMSEKMITGNELRHKAYAATFRNIEANNIEIKTGLGLVKTAIIDQHFVKRSRHNRLLSAVIEYPHLKSIGIDESTAILVKGGKAEVVGESQVLVFENPRKTKQVGKNQKLGARNLHISIYLAGDKFGL